MIANLPIGIEEEHAKEHGNKAANDVISCQLDSQNKQWDAGKKQCLLLFKRNVWNYKTLITLFLLLAFELLESFKDRYF